MNRKQKKVLIRIIISAALMVVAGFVPVSGIIRLSLFLIPYTIIGYDILKKAVRGIINLSPFDENFLMAIATVGAIILGEYTEGCAVMLFYQIGELFQSTAVGKSRRSIAGLMDIRPDFANVEDERGSLIQVDPNEVKTGSVITVLPGERIPIDGEIIEGSTALDTAALTGESAPREVEKGDSVISGCINLSGVIKIRTEKEFSESTVSRILDLVENASSKKSRSENFISKFAKYYTPAVCYGAAALAVIPPLFLKFFMGEPAQLGVWIYRALTFLVISCPCALVISIPLGFFAGIGGASRAGVLVKGSNYLETLSAVKCVVFDKTGTLTKGSFTVSDVLTNGEDKEKVLTYAALCESFSTHPISRSICNAAGGGLDLSRVLDVKEISGYGVTATVDGVPVAVGNEKLMKKLGAKDLETNISGTRVYVAFDGRFAGSIIISDEIKPEAEAAIKELYLSGVKKTVMLTGDKKEVGEAVAKALGISEVHCELLPEDKVRICEELLCKKLGGEKLAFVGDGVNDAPVLSRADVGVAMGALGSDAAIEAADVVLMDDNPLSIAKAIRIAKKCMRIVYQNIYFAIGIKLLCLIFGAVGYADMWLAIFADVGVMVLAVLNAIRTLYVKDVKERS